MYELVTIHYSNKQLVLVVWKWFVKVMDRYQLVLVV
jgi:hypothetical protein